MEAENRDRGYVPHAIALIVLYNLAYFSWLLLHPASHAVVATVDDIANGVGPMLGALTFVFIARPFSALRPRERGGAARAGMILAAAALVWAGGQAVWTYYEHVRGVATPFPSLADAGYLLAHVLLFAGIVMMPFQVLTIRYRLRAVVDGLLLVTAGVTFSWYYVLGPTLLQGGESVFGKVVATAYPLSELVLFLSFVMLTFRSRYFMFGRTGLTLCLGLFIIIGVDSVYWYQILHNTYRTGELLDPAWSLGWMVICLAGTLIVVSARPFQPREQETVVASRARLLQVWPRFVPYALIPAVAALAIYAAQSDDVAPIKAGVFVGSIVLLSLLAVHQVLVVLENVDATMRMQAAWALASEEQALRKSEGRFRTLIQDMQVGVLVVSPDGIVTVANPAAAHMLGLSVSELAGRSVLDHNRNVMSESGTTITGPELPVARAIRLREPIRDVVTGVRVRGEGDQLWFLVNAIPQMNDSGGIDRVLVTYIDITELRRAEDALRENADRLSGIISTQHEIATTQLELGTVMRTIASRTRELTGAESAMVGLVDGGALVIKAESAMYESNLDRVVPLEGTLVGQCVLTGHLQQSHDTHIDPRVNRALTEVMGARSLIGVPIHRDRSVIGVLVVQSSRPHAFTERDAETLQLMVGLIGSAMSNAAEFEARQQLLAERTNALHRVEYQALHDSLTDLPNRVLLHDRLQQAVHAGHREGAPVALLLMDLDRFKEVNDTFGHHYGDLLLQEMSRRLREALRESDTIARLGGDEFAVVLPGTTEEGAITTAEKIAMLLSEPYNLDGQMLTVDASVGIALYPVHGEDAAMLLQRADVAMYVAKRSHAGCVVYAPEQDENSPARLRLVADLRHAIDADELYLNFQWKLDLVRRTYAGVEVLARWIHPEHGPVEPGRFVVLAEETGLIQSLSPWVLRAALVQRQCWAAQGHEVQIAVNLSARNLHDPQIVPTLTELLREYCTEPRFLCVEITESAIIVDPDRAHSTLETMHAMGVRIAIDDFGTGYTSLSYLRDLPIDEIKIDKSFVLGMTRSSDDAVIVRSIIDLGHNLGLEVVAEGVENEETLHLLESMGCDHAQGYHLGPPVPGDSITRTLNQLSATMEPVVTIE